MISVAAVAQSHLDDCQFGRFRSQSWRMGLFLGEWCFFGGADWYWRARLG